MNNLLVFVLLLLACNIQTTESIAYPPPFKCDVHMCNTNGEYQYCSSEKFPRCLLCKDMEDKHCNTDSMPLQCHVYCQERIWKAKRDQPCPLLKELPHGSHNSSSSPRDGEIVEFRCNVGHKLTGPNFLACGYGRWSFEPPTCDAILCSIPTVSNGTINDYNMTRAVGTRVHYQCEKDFRPVDPEGEARCTSEGTWKKLLCIQVENNRNGDPFRNLFIAVCVVLAAIIGGYISYTVWYKRKNKNKYKPIDPENPTQDPDDTSKHDIMGIGDPDCKNTDKLQAKPLPPRSEQPNDSDLPDEADSPNEPLLTETQVKTCGSDSESESESEPDELTEPSETSANNGSPKSERSTDSSNIPEATEGTPPITHAEGMVVQFNLNNVNINYGSNNSNNGNGNYNTRDINTDNHIDSTRNIDDSNSPTAETRPDRPDDQNEGRIHSDDMKYPVQISENDPKPKTPLDDDPDKTPVTTADGAHDRLTGETSNITENRNDDVTSGTSHLYAQPCDRTDNAKLALINNTVHLKDIKRKSKQS